jgi:hypothetical protein
MSDSNKNEEILAHHLGAVSAGNIAAILEDYDENAVVISPYRVVRGVEQIKQMNEVMLKSLPPGSSLQVTQKLLTEKMAYIVWNAESTNVKVPFGTDTFFIENGKIIAQTFALQMIPKA